MDRAVKYISPTHWDPLNCSIDDHRFRFMSADDPETLRAYQFPEFDWQMDA
jgi:hypothetical protein